MLEPQIVSQLKEVFTKLESTIRLEYFHSTHSKQTELISMLEGVASTSSRVEAVEKDETSPVPRFRVLRDGEETGVSFIGIPGGHEFTSLVMAILHADKKGKLPDEGLVRRIQSLKGPINLRTFVSLSCENCPEVVQALNLMSCLHDDFSHQMVDGEFAQEDIEELGIQGVPAVIGGGELISSGKSGLAALLEKLEERFGVKESGPVELGHFDVAIIGGGPAGATAAIYSARKGLNTVLVTDRIGGQLQDTKSIENFISVPLTDGPALSNDLAKHMAEYGIRVLEHRRVGEVRKGEHVEVFMEGGESLTATSMIVATGAKWRELNIPGEKEYLGRGVAFCPHCDGPYYKGKDIAVIGGGNSGVEAAIDLAGIVKSVTLFEFQPELKADAVLVAKLESLPNTTVITNAAVQSIEGDGEKVTTLKFLDRESNESKELNLAGVFVQIGLVPNSGFLGDLVAKNRFGEIEVDEKGRTNVQGIYAAGDVTTVPYKQIVLALGEGARASLAAFEDVMIAEG